MIGITTNYYEENMQREEFIRSVSNDFINNNKSLYFGAGLSKNVNLPNWKDIFQLLINELKAQFIKLDSIDVEDPDSYAVGEYIQGIVRDRNILFDKIAEILKKSSPLNSEQQQLYEYLVRQEYNSIWTTNFDDIFENILKENKYQVNVVDLSSGIDKYHLLKQKRTLYKINGSISDSNRKLILTKNDYESYQDINKSFNSMLKRELICNTFLFIGCSFTDGILRPILRELKQIFKDDFRHYAIFVKSDDVKNQQLMIEDLQERYGVYSYVIEEKENVTQNLTSLLKTIYKYSINKNVFISGSIEDPIDNEIHKNFINKLTNALYDHGYKIIGGVGKKIAYYIGSATSAYMARGDETDRSKYLEQYFFYIDDNNTREKMINRARHTIFIYFPCFNNIEKMKNSGTYKELLISKRNDNTLIPVVKTKIGSGDYCLSDEIDPILQEAGDDDSIIRGIINLLDDRQSIIEAY